MAVRVYRGPEAQLAHRDLTGSLGSQAQAKQGWMVLQDHPGLKGNKEYQESRARLGNLVCLASRGLQGLRDRGSLGQTVPEGSLDPVAQKERLDSGGFLGHPEPLVMGGLG